MSECETGGHAWVPQGLTHWRCEVCAAWAWLRDGRRVELSKLTTKEYEDSYQADMRREKIREWERDKAAREAAAEVSDGYEGYE